jgi:hypothetical protein
MLINSNSVVPANAGTYTPCCINSSKVFDDCLNSQPPRRMGPGVRRGDS